MSKEMSLFDLQTVGFGASKNTTKIADMWPGWAVKLIKMIFGLLRDKRNFEDTVACSVELVKARKWL